MKTYLITGSTGYIGSTLIRFLLQEKPESGLSPEIRIVAPVRNLDRASRMFPAGVEFLQTDLCDRRCVEQLSSAGGDVDYVIHCASITASAEMAVHPVEVAESIINTTQNVLEFARRRPVKSMVYLSSMEVYGNIDCGDGHRVTEDEVSLGAVEMLSSRSCYPLGKRMAENICYSYYKEYDVPVKIARLAQTFGNRLMDTDHRVYAQFARAVREGKNIVLHTRGSSMGNYCDIGDAVRAIMTILEKGEDGEAYNVVNEENTMTVRQMAELAATRIAAGKIQVVYEIPDDNAYGYAPDTGLRMSGQKLAALGWKPQKTLYDMYRDILK